MTAVDDLEDVQTRNGKPDAMTAAEQLAAMLDLPSVGLEIRGGRIVGRGSTASADIHLSDGTQITFESLRDVATPKALALEVAACTGATPNIKAPQAIRAVALLRALAEHHETFTRDQIAVDWGATYLQSAETIDTDLSDQTTRWGAFCRLNRRDPRGHAMAAAVALTAANIVLRHTDGTRYVRCGWFREAIRSQDATVSPQELAQRMERVGWQRRGSRGWIKATQPGGPESLRWTFYVIPVGWEEASA
jgi:hypothetical protein